LAELHVFDCVSALRSSGCDLFFDVREPHGLSVGLVADQPQLLRLFKQTHLQLLVQRFHRQNLFLKLKNIFFLFTELEFDLLCFKILVENSSLQVS